MRGFIRGENPSPVSIALRTIDPPSPTRGERKKYRNNFVITGLDPVIHLKESYEGDGCPGQARA
jgi:hypothetical protein